MTQNIYGITNAAAQTYTGAAGNLPGAAAMSAGILLNLRDPAVTAEVDFGNFTGGNSGWRLRVEPAAAGTGGNAVSVVIETNLWTTTVILGAALNDWLFVAFTKTGTTLTVFINGEAVFATTDVAVVITPQVTAPTLMVAAVAAAVSAAFYTETALTAAQMAAFGGAAKVLPFVDFAFDHLFSAPASLRPVTTALQTWLDTGIVGGVVLTPSVAQTAIVLPGDFGQPVVPIITSGILNAPTAA